MNYFGQDTIQFLQDLLSNNNKDWFAINKSRFKKEVESPFKTFITDLIIELQPYIPNLNIEAKDCIFRIHSGCFDLTSIQIEKIRTHIYNNLKELTH